VGTIFRDLEVFEVVFEYVSFLDQQNFVGTTELYSFLTFVMSWVDCWKFNWTCFFCPIEFSWL